MDDIFQRFLYEAEGDDIAPDMADTPPDLPPDAEDDPGPPDLDDGGDINEPPELGMDDGSSDDGGFYDDTEEGSEEGGEESDQENDPNKNPQTLDAKVSAIMNQNLYHQFLQLLTDVKNQITSIKDNSDILYSINPKVSSVTEMLNKLDDNISIYLKNQFVNENYSKNLLYFNKCINLLKLLNEQFDSAIRKGVKELQ